MASLAETLAGKTISGKGHHEQGRPNTNSIISAAIGTTLAAIFTTSEAIKAAPLNHPDKPNSSYLPKEELEELEKTGSNASEPNDLDYLIALNGLHNNKYDRGYTYTYQEGEINVSLKNYNTQEIHITHKDGRQQTIILENKIINPSVPEGKYAIITLAEMLDWTFERGEIEIPSISDDKDCVIKKAEKNDLIMKIVFLNSYSNLNDYKQNEGEYFIFKRPTFNNINSSYAVKIDPINNELELLIFSKPDDNKTTTDVLFSGFPILKYRWGEHMYEVKYFGCSPLTPTWFFNAFKNSEGDPYKQLGLGKRPQFPSITFSIPFLNRFEKPNK